MPVDWDLSPRPVFTADERRVYRQLGEALPHHIVLVKLPLVRFCQPGHPKQVRYWFDLLGIIHVTSAVCSADGRVLAAIDLSYDRGGPPDRSTRIEQSVMAACRVRYLRCPADHLPSIPELQLLVLQSSHASRGPQPVEGGVPCAVRRTPPGPHRAGASAAPCGRTRWPFRIHSSPPNAASRPGPVIGARPTTRRSTARLLSCMMSRIPCPRRPVRTLPPDTEATPRQDRSACQRGTER